MDYQNKLNKEQIELEDKICNYINLGDYSLAINLLGELKKNEFIYTDNVAILEATIHNYLGDTVKEFECIKRGLAYNYSNYELYFMLGNYYSKFNKNQAYLCYENAEYFCTTEDVQLICDVKNQLMDTGAVSVVPTSIVILSYNSKEITSLCLDSIRQNTFWKTYEIIVVDNASKDGSAQWLYEYEVLYKNTYGLQNLTVLYNDENKGFPGGCNQGIKTANKENNIFLLNNDTVVPPNAIFWLRMGLYENDDVGAVGSVSNHANNDQMVKEKKDAIEEWFQYGIINNIPMQYPYEKKAWLMGFAILFKRSCLEKVGYLDEIFSPGNYEDNDIGYRFLKEGYTQLLCKNSFIFHFGSVGFRKNQKEFDALLRINRKKIIEKHGYAIEEYTWVRTDLVEYLINSEKNTMAPINVLDIGSGLGATMAKIESIYPYAKIYGIEKHKEIARVGKNLANIIEGDIEVIEPPFKKGYFNYMIFGNVLEYLDNPNNVIRKLEQYLCNNGKMIISISKAIIKEDVIKSIDIERFKELFYNRKFLKVESMNETRVDHIIILSRS